MIWYQKFKKSNFVERTTRASSEKKPEISPVNVSVTMTGVWYLVSFDEHDIE